MDSKFLSWKRGESQILAELPNTKILAISMYDYKEFMSGMLHAGALGYILKGCNFAEIYAAIRKVAAPGIPD